MSTEPSPLQAPPQPDIYEDAPGTPAAPAFDVRGYVADCVKRLQAATEAALQAWGLGTEESWNLDQALGRFTFRFADGRRVTVPAQVVGIYRLQAAAFVWGWHEPTVAVGMMQHALHCKAFGGKHDFIEFTQPMVICTPDHAWTYAATAAHLAGVPLAYRVPLDNETFVYLTLGEPPAGAA